MGCFLSCLACNAASCLCQGACKCCGKATVASELAGRIAYAVQFFAFALIAWVFRMWGEDMLHWVPVLKQFCEEEDCYGVLAVYRVSFCLALFHLFLGLITIGVSKKGDFRTQIQDGFWPIKLLVLAGGCIACFFLPNANTFFSYYGWISLAASGIFILVQLLFLIDFAHSWAENWIQKYEEEELESNKWWWILLATTITIFLLSVIGTILMYIFFCKDAKCSLNISVVTINLILAAVVTALSIHPKIQESNERSGLLQPSVIVGYCTYLIFSAIMSEVGSECNPWARATEDGVSNNLSLLIGAVFTVAAVCYATIRAASLAGDAPSDDPESAPLTQETDHAEDEGNVQEQKDPDEPVTYNYSRFHLMFVLGSMYLAMLMTDWSTVYSPGKESQLVDSGWAAVWVKIVSSWLCYGLFTWTLVGPALFPDREWK